MKATRALLAACLLAVTTVGCSSDSPTDPEPEPTATLSGFVRDAETQTPIAGATVTVGEKSTTTSEGGRFELTQVPVGQSVEIEVSAVGFDPVVENVMIQVGSNSHDILLQKKTIYESGPFTIYMSPGISAYRGVAFFLTGADGDARPFIRGEVTEPPIAVMQRQQFLELAESYGLGFMGNHNSHYDSPTGVQDVLSALATFAQESGRPELEQAPLLLIGYSRGGRWGRDIASEFPTRVIGFFDYKGADECCFVSGWESIGSIPTYIQKGELDNVVGMSSDNFDDHRAEGALWALAIEPGAGHEFAPDSDVLFHWLDAVVSRRLPEDPEPGVLPNLRPVDEETGWLGNLTTFEIAPFAEYGDDPSSASWLPNEETARDWHELVSGSGVE